MAVSKGAAWSLQIRNEFDILVKATQGIGCSAMFQMIAVEATLADNGTLKTSDDQEGYAWDPAIYSKKNPSNPVQARIKSAAASLGRILSGGHPTHRTYLAFMEAIYQVTAAQDYDVTARIEKLWDEVEAVIEEEQVIADTKRGVFRRLIDRFLSWWRHSYYVEDPHA